MNYRLITSVAGLFLFIPSAMGLLITGYPTILHPFPAITVLPAFLLASLHLWMVGAVAPVAIFFVWNPVLLRGEPRIPKRSFVLIGLAIIFSIVGFGVGGGMAWNTKARDTYGSSASSMHYGSWLLESCSAEHGRRNHRLGQVCFFIGYCSLG